MQKSLQKYYGFFLIEYQRVKLYIPDIIVRALIISLRLALPYSVLSVLVSTRQIDQEMANAMIWAVLIGQILNGASFKVHMKIREDIRTGNISTRLSEPVNYIYAKLFQCFGYFIPLFVTYSLIFFVICAFLFPTDINIPVLLLFTFLSFLVLNSISIILGLTSFMIEENDGLYWITMKLFFIFGNQVIPVALMPVAVINFAKYTPFYLGLAGPIEAASGRLDIVQGIITSIIYIILFMFVAQFMLNKFKKRLVMNG